MSGAGPSASRVSKLQGDPALLRQRIDLSGAAASCIEGAESAAAMLECLVAADFLAEAVKLLAHALPKREAIWWACMCARHTAPPDLPAVETEAAAVAEAWVRRPTEEARRVAFNVAEKSRFGGAESWAAMAAFWSGGSMAPVGQPEVPPAPHLCGLAVAGSVTLASVRDRPERREARLRRFVASGREIAEGGNGRLPHEDAQEATAEGPA